MADGLVQAAAVLAVLNQVLLHYWLKHILSQSVLVVREEQPQQVLYRMDQRAAYPDQDLPLSVVTAAATADRLTVLLVVQVARVAVDLAVVLVVQRQRETQVEHRVVAVLRQAAVVVVPVLLVKIVLLLLAVPEEMVSYRL